MSANIITRWIDRNNYKICLKINKRYYKKKDKGLLIKFYINPITYLYFIARLFFVFLQGLRFNANLIERFPFTEEFSLKEKLFGRITQLLGLSFFVKQEYTPYFYHKQLKNKELKFEKTNSPKVSIIIPVHNQLKYTLTCLKSLKINLDDGVSYEIIVVNDASTDQTSASLGKIEGVRLIDNENNLGFLKSCQKGITEARGEYICLLNNDTIVLKNWLSELVDTIEKDSSIGLVGSKLIYPFGLLQEAGGIIYNDASGCNYGNYDDSNYFAFNFSRETDYCSGASILFRKTDFDQLNGFDQQFAPAYYEDTDLCFSIRHLLNKKVIYQPLSTLVHFEGISSGKVSKKGNVKNYQTINKGKFLSKWKNVLVNYPSQNSPNSYMKYLSRNKIVVVDAILPRFDKDSGSHRMYELLKIFKELNLQIVFIPNSGKCEQPYYNLLTRNGVEVVTKYAGRTYFKKEVVAATLCSTYIWVCRPGLNKKYRYIKKYNKNAKWIYDTVDLHFVRLEREANLLHSNKKLRRAKRYKALELKLAKRADITVCITDVEQSTLKKEGITNTVVIPNIHRLPILKNTAGFEDRKGLLFIGSYDHPPNVDAAIWLSKEIMPRVWTEYPDMKLHLVGNNPKPEIQALNNSKVIVHGYVENLDTIFNSCRIFVAPLRYGAGMKGKIGQALSYGLPIVTTDIGVEGMGLENGKNILVANTIETIIDAIVELYGSKNLWDKIHKNSQETIKYFLPENIKSTVHQILS